MRSLVPRFSWGPVLALLVLLVVLLTPGVDRSEVAFTEPKSKPQEAENTDTGTAGMGEEALGSVPPGETSRVSGGRITRDVPDHPFKGQKRPPCAKRFEVEIKRGCWATSAGVEPPCAVGWYQYEGLCYFPVILPQPEPTSAGPK
jgi:hypothetical protein